ncbi:hypothetical protein [Mycolicibacterium hodleri]|uniref:Uncharacterized protein n=1 Tax=Mycolicibacterium hodleri TaxID=49897 RepID=A0A502E5V6_9MYCO|nr:hypothetical protein [Mycolicibacterium hodleri]TPG33033.1 hypothetical protein EAH80_16635 [Mycolicibacterium hodleri]
MSVGQWDRYRDRASARRAAARELHPDLGGDAAALADALASIDAHFRPPPSMLVQGSGRRTCRLRVIHPLRRILRRRRFIQL